MYVDIDGQTVTFTAGTTLTVDQIYALLDLLEVDGDGDGDEPQDWLPGWVLPDHIYIINSASSPKQYCVVRLEDGSWSCSCPDYIYRQHKTGDNCKHIVRMRWLV